MCLWSTVLNQEARPGTSLQDSSRRRVRSATVVTWLLWRLLEALEVGEEGLQLLGGQRLRRHLVARLDRLGVDDPAAQVPAGVGQSTGADGAAAAEMAEVGTQGAARRRAPDRKSTRL